MAAASWDERRTESAVMANSGSIQGSRAAIGENRAAT
jgi:hypothetical protein